MYKNGIIKIIPESIKLLDISDEIYFSKKYKSYVSNSRLSLINEFEDGNPQKYKEGLVSDEGAKSFFTLGSAVHQIILQPDSYKICTDICKPGAKMFTIVEDVIELRKKGYSIYDAILESSEKVNYFKGKLNEENLRKIIRYKDAFTYYLYKNSLDYKEFDGDKELIYLDSYSRYQAFECIKSLKSSDSLKLFKPIGLLEDPLVFNESTLICDIEVTLDDKKVILPTKLKIDNWTLDLENDILTLNDLKTSYHGPSKFKDSFHKFNYDRQMGMYFAILNEYTKIKYNKTFNKFSNIVVVGTNKPFDVGIFPVQNSDIKRGISEFKRLISKVAYHEINGYDI